MKYRIASIIGAWALSYGNLANAQNNNNDNVISNWWQVEVIMFTQGTNWATTLELWPTDVELAYPEQWQQITPLENPEAATEADSALAGTDSTAPQLATDSTPELFTADGYLNPEIIHTVPDEELQLTEMRQHLDRGRRRILYHGAWRQYMEPDQAEAPIIFTAGDQYDDHYELEGSIHVYLQRYLHFDVNLWLTEFSINAGQERKPWPDLPRRPNQEAPLNLATMDRPDADPNSSVLNNPANNRFGGPDNSGTINTLDWLDQRGNTTFYDSRYDEILSRNYVVNNLALIQQDRPMRSEELHYIDHPLLGILVKITRYQPPVPTGMEDDPLDELLGPRPE